MKQKNLKLITRIAKGIAIAVIIFGLPFYFGYGNPLPFINPDYTIWDNMWLSIFPLMFIGLGLGLKFEKIGGYLVTIPLVLGFIFSFIWEREVVFPMLVPLLVGILYLVVGYKQDK